MKKFIDINGKERTAEKLKIITHKVKDAVNDEDIPVKFVEAHIVGRTGRKWVEWYPLKKFKKLNPNIKLREK